MGSKLIETINLTILWVLASVSIILQILHLPSVQCICKGTVLKISYHYSVYIVKNIILIQYF